MLSSLYSVRSRRDTDGFTLIELLVVVIIIGLLAAIALPIFIDQTKTSVDASVKADVRNTVTNVVNAQAQATTFPTSAKAAVSDANTNIALKIEATGGAIEVATKSNTTLGNVPALGTSYSIHGWNQNGKAYLGSAAKPAFTFNSASGLFTQGTGDAPVAAAASDSSGGSGSTGGQATGTTLASFNFESGTQGWSSYYANFSAAMNFNGHNALKADLSSVGNVIDVNSGSNRIAVVSGKSYTISANVYVQSTNSDVEVRLYDSPINGTITKRIIAPGSWQPVSVTYTASSTVSSGGMLFSLYKSGTGNLPPGAAFYIDDVVFTQN